MANAFVHVELNTTDLDKAKKFYGQLFDWKLKDEEMGPTGRYTMIDPGRMARTMSSVTSFGARAPGTSTAPITRSASGTSCSIASTLLITVWIRPRWI